MQVNWRKGFLRLWIVFSIAWIAVCFSISEWKFSDETLAFALLIPLIILIIGKASKWIGLGFIQLKNSEEHKKKSDFSIINFWIYCCDVFQGKKTLSQTYWLFYAVPLAFINVLYYALLSASFSLSKFNYNAILYTLLLLTIIFVYGFGVAVIRSARDKNKIGFWGGVAILIVVANMLRTPVEFFGSASNDISYEQELEKQISFINSGLPKKVDEVTTLQRVSYKDKSFIYHYIIDNTDADIINLKSIKGRALLHK